MARLNGATALVAGISTLVALGALELGARHVVAKSFEGVRVPKAITPLYSNVGDPALRYRLTPSTRFRAAKGFSATELCYDATYTIDRFGRRAVEPASREPRPLLVLFGCSFTFGEGIPDHDTLQFHLTREFDVANYAVPGYGPQHVLTQIDGGTLPAEIVRERAIGVYVLPPFHLRRASPRSSMTWLFKSPAYVLDADGELRRFDSFKEARPIASRAYRAYDWLRRRSFALGLLNVDLPLFSFDDDLALVTAIAARAARSFEGQLGGPFFVALHPWWRREGDLAGAGKLRRALEAAGVRVLDYSALETTDADMIRADCDQHPSAHLARRLSDRLLDDLAAVNGPES